MNPITTTGEVSSTMNKILQGIQIKEKIIVAFTHNFGIFYLFYLGISYSA